MLIGCYALATLCLTIALDFLVGTSFISAFFIIKLTITIIIGYFVIVNIKPFKEAKASNIKELESLKEKK